MIPVPKQILNLLPDAGKPSSPAPVEWIGMKGGALERAFTTRLLALTNGEQLEVDALRDSMRITSEAFDSLMQSFSDGGLLSIQNGSISLGLEQRLDVAMRAIEAGADPEVVSRCLGWLEFEELSARVFETNGFHVMRRFRFTAEGRRWELDILAVCAPYLVCSECKHWGKGMGNQTARGIIEMHLEKVEVFSKHIEELRERIGICGWSRAVAIPMALTLSATPMEIYRRVPSVSVLSLPSFINEFGGQLERLANFKLELTPVKTENKQTKPKKGVSGSRRAHRR